MNTKAEQSSSTLDFYVISQNKKVQGAAKYPQYVSSDNHLVAFLTTKGVLGLKHTL